MSYEQELKARYAERRQRLFVNASFEEQPAVDHTIRVPAERDDVVPPYIYAPLIDAATQRAGISRDHFWSRRRRRGATQARSEVYAELLRMDYSPTAVGMTFGYDRSTVAQLAAKWRRNHE